MNGNFEFDKSAYPYAAGYQGTAWRIVNVQTRDNVTELKVPRKVAEAVALDLNSLYWARKVEKLRDLKEGLSEHVKATAYRLYKEEHAITATDYQAVSAQVAALTSA